MSNIAAAFALLPLVGKGMAGVFGVIIVIWASVELLMKTLNK